MYGGAFLLQNGYRQDTLESGGDQALSRELEKFVSSWCNYYRPPEGSLLCITSTVYTNLWTSVAFCTRPAPLQAISKLRRNSRQPSFLTWAPLNFPIVESSYPASTTHPLPGADECMDACFAIRALQLVILPQKRWRIPTSQSSASVRPSGTESGGSASATSRTRSGLSSLLAESPNVLKQLFTINTQKKT